MPSTFQQANDSEDAESPSQRVHLPAVPLFQPLIRPLNLAWLGAHSSWVVLSTFVKHTIATPSRKGTSTAHKFMAYDQAFEIVKSFLQQASHDTVEALQAFCNTFVPSPFYVLIVRVLIPPECTREAADILIQHVGEDKCLEELGGKQWWQRRPRSDGCLEAEWISMKKDWDGQDLKENMKKRPKEKAPDEEPPTRHMTDRYHSDLDEQRCLFYVHGGQ
jgi:hypothetical protein